MLALWACSASAATISVTTTVDELNSDGDCSLREAVQAANTNAPVDACAGGAPVGDVVLFTAIAGQTINLTLGQIEVTDGVTIGSAASAVTIDANDTGRIFRVDVVFTNLVEPVTFENLTLRDGSGSGGGGAVFVADGEVTAFTNVRFDSNTSDGSGGALRLGLGSAPHTLTSCVFTGNRTTAGGETDGGGALYIRSGVLELAGGGFGENTARTGAASGGAVYLGPNAALTIRQNLTERTYFTQNGAARAGGAIEVAGSLSVAGATFVGNTTSGNGGAVHLTGGAAVTMSGALLSSNEAQMEGGAVWTSADGALTVTETSIQFNVAAGPAPDQGGGGLYNDGGVVTLLRVVFSGNDATGAAGSGGGILNTGSGRVTMTGGSIGRNTAVRAGGAVETTSPAGVPGNLVRLMDVSIGDNDAGTAPGFGGGVHITGSGAVTVTGGTVSRNRAIEGGGFWKSATGTLIIDGTTVSTNTATGASADQGGGGVFSDGGPGLTITDAVFQSNAATGTAGSGGALFLNTGSTSTVSNTTLSGNTANRAGGGIEDNASARLTLSNVTMSANNAGLAPGNGGAVHITGAGTVVIDSSRVLNNVAANQGGGLWNSGTGQLTVRYSAVSGNTARTGGGLYQTATTEGLSGRTTVEASLVSGNRASASGGGLAAGGATVSLTNTTLSGNMAVNGGGAVTSGGRLLLSSVTVASNSATTAGGGLVNTDMGAASLLTLDNTVVADNTAPTGADLSGAVLSRGYNLFETTASATVMTDTGGGPDQTGLDPGLQPLADNGGPTRTHALLVGSPAARAGRTALLLDQRGYARTGTPSIGAFEFGGVSVAGEEDPVAAAPPPALALSAPAPNPFRTRSVMRFTAAVAGPVHVALIDARGRQVQTLYSGTASPGTPVEISVDGSSLPAGVYVVRLTSSTEMATQRLTVVR